MIILIQLEHVHNERYIVQGKKKKLKEKIDPPSCMTTVAAIVVLLPGRVQSVPVRSKENKESSYHVTQDIAMMSSL